MILRRNLDKVAAETRITRIGDKENMHESAEKTTHFALSMAERGTELEVCSLAGTPDDMTRMKRLGICVGRSILVVQRGDPMIVVAAGCRVGISRRLANEVQVANRSATFQEEGNAVAETNSAAPSTSGPLNSQHQ